MFFFCYFFSLSLKIVHTKNSATHGLDQLDITSSETDNTDTGLKTNAISHAADALRQILKKLPINIHLPTSPDTDNHDDHDDHDHVDEHNLHSLEENFDSIDNEKKKHTLQQYDIPSDPHSVVHHLTHSIPSSSGHSNHLNSLPSFKPLALPVDNSYQNLGPINSLTHTQTITTAYGAPISNFQRPIPLVDVKSPSSSSSPDAYNLYHSMSLKLGNNNPLNLSPPLPPPSQSHAYHHPNSYIGQHEFMDNRVHQQQINQLSHTFGPDFIIQKSLGFELRNPHPVQLKRRLFTLTTD